MKRGFTLIELLAVIVILAIIALIATPIVLSIIEETKDNASLRSAEFYLDAVENSIAIATLNNRRIIDGKYNILNTGNICIEEIENECKEELVIEVKGEKPNKGTITIQNGKIEGVSLSLNDKVIVKGENGELLFSELKYMVGDEVTFNPGDMDRTWNVIGEDTTTVTLMLTENLGNTVAWYAASEDNNYGPKDALEYLNTLTVNWDNVEPIRNYSYINNLNGTTKQYGYQKLEIQNGRAKLTHKDGEIIIEVAGVSKARIITWGEFWEIILKTDSNLTEEKLRTFIFDNLAKVNEIFKSEGMEMEFQEVDELIYFVAENESTIQYASKYLQTYYVYLIILELLGEGNTGVNTSIPEFLEQNIDVVQAPHAYWTLSTYADSDRYSQIVGYDGYYASGNINDMTGHGVRPVISILKSKLKK